MTALVGIIMGSDSDLPIMSEAAEILESLRVPVEVHTLSAHRTPDEAGAYAKSAKENGLKVIIAGAGGAAHLAGVLAALTTLPVIAVPVKGKSLDGLDSLLSMVQMPPGIPVATVGINAAKNAGLLAAKIIALGHEELSSRLEKYSEDQKQKVLEKDKKIQQIGYKEYLKK